MDSEHTRTAPGLSAAEPAPPFEDLAEGTEPSWVGRDPATGRLLPGFPGPRYTGKVTSTIARAAKLVEAMQPLVERRDAILSGGAAARSELVRMLANSVVALDHFEKEIGARLVLEGPLTGKGYSKAALSTAGNLATQKSRLIDKLLPLLAAAAPETPPRFDPSILTDAELDEVNRIIATAAARADAPPPPEPAAPLTFEFEIPDEEPAA